MGEPLRFKSLSMIRSVLMDGGHSASDCARAPDTADVATKTPNQMLVTRTGSLIEIRLSL
jgi:hypothetical protein